jgi:hypothetical protein
MQYAPWVIQLVGQGPVFTIASVRVSLPGVQ